MLVDNYIKYYDAYKEKLDAKGKIIVFGYVFITCRPPRGSCSPSFSQCLLSHAQCQLSDLGSACNSSR